MTKKSFLWVLMSVLSLPVVLFTSCEDDEESEVAKEQRETKEVHDKLVQNYNIDLSAAICGESSLGKWDMKDDSTFTYYFVTNLKGDSQDNLTYDLDSLTGRWSAFSNVGNLWDDNGVTLSGFYATIDLPEGWEIDNEDGFLTFYIVYQEDGVTITMEKTSIDYLFTNVTNVNDSVSDTKFWVWDAIVYVWDNLVPEPVKAVLTFALQKIEKWKDTIADFFTGLFGDNTALNLNKQQCQEYWDYADKIVDAMQEEKNADTDYSNWMSQIYKGKESTTRLCEMNIPGTHDSYTYYMKKLVTLDAIKTRAISQLKDIEGQWNAGIRCFDIRFRTTDGNLSVPLDLLTKKCLGIFHGDFYCGILAQPALDKLIEQLKKHPGETAIAMCAIEGEKSEELYKLIRQTFEDDRVKDYIIWNPQPDMTLADCQGKLVVFQCWDDGNEYKQYRIGASIEGCFNNYRKDVKMRFYDSDGMKITNCLYQNYCQPAETTELCTPYWLRKRAGIQDCILDCAATKGSSDNVWCINQASGFVGALIINMSYAKSSNHINPATFYMIYNNAETLDRKLGIVVMDYAGTNEYYDHYYVNGEALSKLVVETNRYQ